MSYSEIHHGPMAAENFTPVHNLLFRSGGALTPTEVTVFGHIASHRERWKTSAKQVAEGIGVSLPTAKKALAGLRAKSLLMYHQRRDEHGQLGEGSYFITDLRFQLMSVGITDEQAIRERVRAAFDEWLVRTGRSEPGSRIFTPDKPDTPTPEAPAGPLPPAQTSPRRDVCAGQNRGKKSRTTAKPHHGEVADKEDQQTLVQEDQGFQEDQKSFSLSDAEPDADAQEPEERARDRSAPPAGTPSQQATDVILGLPWHGPEQLSRIHADELALLVDAAVAGGYSWEEIRRHATARVRQAHTNKVAYLRKGLSPGYLPVRRPQRVPEQRTPDPVKASTAPPMAAEPAVDPGRIAAIRAEAGFARGDRFAAITGEKPQKPAKKRERRAFLPDNPDTSRELVAS